MRPYGWVSGSDRIVAPAPCAWAKCASTSSTCTQTPLITQGTFDHARAAAQPVRCRRGPSYPGGPEASTTTPPSSRTSSAWPIVPSGSSIRVRSRNPNAFASHARASGASRYASIGTTWGQALASSGMAAPFIDGNERRELTELHLGQLIERSSKVVRFHWLCLHRPVLSSCAPGDVEDVTGAMHDS